MEEEEDKKVISLVSNKVRCTVDEWTAFELARLQLGISEKEWSEKDYKEKNRHVKDLPLRRDNGYFQMRILDTATGWLRDLYDRRPKTTRRTY